MNKSKTTHIIARVLFITFFYLLCLGQFQRFQFTQNIAIYIHEVVLILLVLILGPELIKEYSVFFQKIKTKKSVLALLIFFVVQTYLFQLIQFDLVSLAYFLRIVLYSQLFFITKIFLDRELFTKKYLYLCLVGISTFVAVAGLIQYVFWPDTRWFLTMGWDDHYYRLISTLFDPGFTGLVIGCGLMIYLLKFASQKLNLRDVIFSGLYMVSLLLTYSRASFLAVGVVLLTHLIRSKNRLLIFITLLFFALIPVLPRPSSEGVKLERTASISSRINSNQIALESLSLSEVIWGKGLYREIIPAKNDLPSHAVAPDNSFVFLFVSLGVVGLALLVWVFVELRTSIFREPFASLLLLISVHSLFNNSLFYIWSMVFLWVTLVCVKSKNSVTV